MALPFSPAPVTAYRDSKHAVHAFKVAVKYAAATARPNGYSLLGPKAMNVVFVMKQPKGSKGLWHKIKPDLDNCLKAIKDAMKNTIYRDDCQVVHLSAWKVCSPAEKPRVIVEVSDVPEGWPDEVHDMLSLR